MPMLENIRDFLRITEYGKLEIPNFPKSKHLKTIRMKKLEKFRKFGMAPLGLPWKRMIDSVVAIES
jgi:hypothetical protein